MALALTAGIVHPLFFDTLGERSAKLRDAEATTSEGESKLLCTACGNRISSDAERIVVAGQHEHECSNPAGILYRIGCFSDATGCTQVGAATLEWSWFKGFAWRVALCSRCGTHMGWGYDGTSAFYGLILDRLAAE